MRHTATTLMIRSGIDLKTVKEICGHKNTQATMSYAHLIGENLRIVAQSFSIKPDSKVDVFTKQEELEILKVFPKLRLLK